MERIRADANTLAHIRTRDFREGYEFGSRDYFTRYDELIHVEDGLLDLLKTHAQDDLYLGGKQDTLCWAIDCAVGEPSGRLFPPTQQRHPSQLPRRRSCVSPFPKGRKRKD